LLSFAVLPATSQEPPPNIDSRASTSSIQAPVAEARIEVQKANRKLLLYSGEKLLRTYPVGLGFNPVEPKKVQGDGATPEGEYFVCVKNPHSRYFLSLGLSYPNSLDADRALKTNLVTKVQRDRIVESERRGTCPPWNTRLGGEIFIHGRGSSSDWTLGCVALDDPDMAELFRAVELGSKVVIKP
jgi:murein L,D-transpeptidase YafK